MAFSGEERPWFASDEDYTRFMKGGGCKDAYEAFSACLTWACREGAAVNLKKCMEEHAHHYAPVLADLHADAGAGEGKGVKDDREEEEEDSFFF